MSTKIVKPKHEGVIVRDPITMAPMAKEGREVPWNGPEGTFWRRRLMDGTIEIVKPPEAKEEEPKKEEPRKRSTTTEKKGDKS